MKTDPWVTWWSHAQRGCGLINQQQPTHQCVNIHRLPEASAIRFRFSNFYDTQDVEITNVTLTYHDQEFPITFQKHLPISYIRMKQSSVILWISIVWQRIP